MIKILINVPYPELYDPYARIIARRNLPDIQFEITHIVGTSLDIDKIGQPDIVIARGLTKEIIKKQFPNVHVIEMATTGYDLLKSLDEIQKKFHSKCIAYLSTEEITCDTETVNSLTGIRLLVYKVKNENDILKILDQKDELGIDAFIGGRTAYEFCEARNIPANTIRVSIEAVERSFAEAVNSAKILNSERVRISLLEKIINSMSHAVIAVNEEGAVTVCNRLAYQIFGCASGKELHTRRADDLFGDGWNHCLQTSKTHEYIDQILGKLCIISCNPIFMDKKSCGILYTVQPVDNVQESASKIRSELRQKGLTAKYSFADILGESTAIKLNIQAAIKYSKVNANVLLVGETGTGKELFAHSIHRASSRNKEPFVAINCAALPENLLESELFGYTEGAFSGAVKGGKTGLFELADKGTLFLDEIGELPPTLQAKLLRALQEKEIRKIGDDRVIPIDVRVISATNINIQEKIRQGLFRADLYYRLNLLDIHLQPLRERPEDIAILVKKFIGDSISITPQAIEHLQNYSWPGNVRELKNICKKLVVLNETGQIDAEDVELLDLPGSEESESQDFSLKKLEEYSQEELERLIAVSGIKKQQLAKELGVSRSTLWRYLYKK